MTATSQGQRNSVQVYVKYTSQDGDVMRTDNIMMRADDDKMRADNDRAIAHEYMKTS